MKRIPQRIKFKAGAWREVVFDFKKNVLDADHQVGIVFRCGEFKSAIFDRIAHCMNWRCNLIRIGF